METRRRKKGSLSDNTNASNSSDKKDDPQDKGRGDVKNTTEESTMMRLCGFDSSDFTSWTAFVKLMNRPSDPASLAATRILFGMLQNRIKDILQLCTACMSGLFWLELEINNLRLQG